MLAQISACGNAFFGLAAAAQLFAAEPAFLGKNSCSSSSCHGGGGPGQNQSIVWAERDPHSRAPATLTTARSKRLAQLLEIKDPAKDARCTVCHAPWQNLPEAALPSGATAVAEAVSCESCHGPASNYLRSHTRTDLTRAQKAADGLRDLTVLYNRANSCVACHQVLDPQLLAAGHPELLFELDGQTAAMPRHWREREANTHALAWLTGQAAALRELTAQLARQPGERVLLQWQSALWLLQTALPQGPLAEFDTNSVGSAEQLSRLHDAAGQLARSPQTVQGEPLLQNILRAAFSDANQDEQLRRAERLVLAIDRLLYSLPRRSPEVQRQVQNLFELVQSRPDFNARRLNDALRNIREELKP